MISVYTVSVGYSEHLEKSLSLWRQLSGGSTYVVTSPDDIPTIELCRSELQYGHCVQTDIFTRNGASFNKGAALSLLYRMYPPHPDNWVIVVDADITMKNHDAYALYEKVKSGSGLVLGNLYGAHRLDEKGSLIRDPRICGWFLMFHASDPKLQDPLFETCWPHCGNYDDAFIERWPEGNRHWLLYRTHHTGPVRTNWCGIGNEGELRAVLARRRRHGNHWKGEKMTNPPELV